jgi:hypothetical protein
MKRRLKLIPGPGGNICNPENVVFGYGWVQNTAVPNYLDEVALLVQSAIKQVDNN